MSWDEYSDMFDKAQEIGQYRCHVFDMKDSRKGYDNKKFWYLLELFGNKIDKKHIHTSKQFPKVPFITAGDIIVLITKRGSISDEEVYKCFKEAKEESKLGKDFRYLSGYYETDEWVKGNVEYHGGYCIPELEHRSKKRKELL